MVYEVETEQLGTRVARRYRHFLWLYDKLAELFPCLSLPPLPVKHFSGEIKKKICGTERKIVMYVVKEGEKKIIKLTPPTGLEPATPGLGGRCHIH